MEGERKGCGSARLTSRPGATKRRCPGGQRDAARRCGLVLGLSMLHAQAPRIYGDGAGPGWPMSRLGRAEWAQAGLARRDAGPAGGGVGWGGRAAGGNRMESAR